MSEKLLKQFIRGVLSEAGMHIGAPLGKDAGSDKKDSKAGAVAAINNDKYYGGQNWTEADTKAVPDPQTPYVWLVMHLPTKDCLAVNVKLGQVVEEFDFDEAMAKYGKQAV